MKIRLNNGDTKKLYALLETKQENITMASMFNDLCFSLDQFIDLDAFRKLPLEEFNEKCKELFSEYFELDPNNEYNMKILEIYLSNAFSPIDLDKYNKNPYKETIKIDSVKQNGHLLHYLSYPKFSFFPLDDIKVDEKDYFREHTSLGFSSKDYSYLTLSKNNNIWMCITPNEINTMSSHLKNAKGRVITFGLGLGYFAFMASNKKEVHKVTIIEKNKDIINLFNEKLLPLFPSKEKIEIIEDDAFSYIERTRLEGYDYVFYDLWHNAEDGLPIYIKLREMKLPLEAGYWIEESLIAMYRRCLLTVIEESLQGYTDDDYRRSKNPIEKIINQIYFKTKNMTFTSFKEIYNLLTREGIIKLIEKN